LIDLWLRSDAKDLIYEGIATFLMHQLILRCCYHDAKDLIYEGIATLLFDFVDYNIIPSRDAKDLIYEGIATSINVNVQPNETSPGRQRPDLRRDCDDSRSLMIASSIIFPTPKT